MKSRFAILAMLVTGMLFSTAGAGLAISGIQDNAAVSQYGKPECTPTPTPPGGENPQGGDEECEEGGVLPAEENNPASEQGGGGGGGGGTAPAADSEDGDAAPAQDTATQAERQSAAQAETSSQLPVTGFAAIPVLVGGLALLAGGLLLRRRTT